MVFVSVDLVLVNLNFLARLFTFVGEACAWISDHDKVVDFGVVGEHFALTEAPRCIDGFHKHTAVDTEVMGALVAKSGLIKTKSKSNVLLDMVKQLVEIVGYFLIGRKSQPIISLTIFFSMHG